MSTDSPPNGEQGAVEDPTNIKQRRRIEAVLDARERVAEQHRKALDLQARGQIDDQLARRMIRQAVKEYALESEHVIKTNLPHANNDPREWSKEEEAAYHTWNERELGRLELRSGVYEFQGLEDFVDAPRVITETWREEAGDPVAGANETLHQDTHQIPIGVSEAAYRALNYFWHEFGMDLEMENQRPFHDFAEDYEDGIYE